MCPTAFGGLNSHLAKIRSDRLWHGSLLTPIWMRFTRRLSSLMMPRCEVAHENY
jgi:hypothetical protein